MILRSTVDAHVQEAQPKTNWGASTTLWVNGGTGGNDARAFVYFPIVFPLGSTILSAKLRVRVYNPAASLSGTYTLNALRVLQPWAESTINWNNQPSAGGSPASQARSTPIADNSIFELDVTSLLQDVSTGGQKYFGFRLGLTENKDLGLRSGEASNLSVRPELEITWSESPNAPTGLTPDGGAATGTAFPILSWQFSDPAGNTQQAYSQVQIDDTGDFVSPDYDSTKTANTEPRWDTNDGVFAGISAGTSKYWRVRVWDGTDLVSPWSAVATFSRVDHGVLTITVPGATVDTTTPAVTWTLTGGEPQQFYRVTLFSVDASGVLTQLWTTSGADATTSVEVPHGLIHTGGSYRVRVEVWDDVLRFGDDHLTDEQDFTYVRSGVPAAVTTLTATPADSGPDVLLHWTRASTPTYFSLRVDGVEVADRIVPADVQVSAGVWELRWWQATPRVSHTYEVEAVETVSGDLEHSDGNATAVATTTPIGIWLADEADSLAVRIEGGEDNPLAVGRSGTTYYPIGRQAAPVHVSEGSRGYEGTVAGSLPSAAVRDAFLLLSSRDAALRLVIGDLNIPVRMVDGSAWPTPVPGDRLYGCTAEVYQVGAPWPVTA